MSIDLTWLHKRLYKKFTPNVFGLESLSQKSTYWTWRKVVAWLLLAVFPSTLLTPMLAYSAPDINNTHQTLNKTSPDKFPSKDSLLTKGINLGMGKSSPRVLRNTSSSSVQHKYQGYLEIGGARYFNQRAKVAGIYDLFIPLLQTDEQLIFTDLRIFDRSGSAAEGNFHLGYRRLYPASNQMLGMYTAFDMRKSEAGNVYRQVMFGIEYWHNRLFLGGNIYKPLGVTKNLIKVTGIPKEDATGRSILITNRYEKVLGGGDGEVGYALTDNLTWYVGGYYFHGADMSTIAGPKTRVTYNYNKPAGRIFGVIDAINLEAGAQHDKPRGTTAYVGIKFKFGLTNSNKNTNLLGFERHMTELVRRDPDIVIAEKNTTEDFFQQGNTQGNDDSSNDYSKWSTEQLLEVLGLSANATIQEIKVRYKKLVRQYHPDKTKIEINAAREEIERINDIYSILKKRMNLNEKSGENFNSYQPMRSSNEDGTEKSSAENNYHEVIIPEDKHDSYDQRVNNEHISALTKYDSGIEAEITISNPPIATDYISVQERKKKMEAKEQAAFSDSSKTDFAPPEGNTTIEILSPNLGKNAQHDSSNAEIYTDSNLLKILNKMLIESRELTEKQICTLEQIIRDQAQGCTVQVLAAIIKLLTYQTTHFATNTAHVTFLLDVAKADNFLREYIIRQFAEDVFNVPNGKWRNNDVFNAFALLLPFTDGNELTSALIYANEVHAYYADIEALPYFAKLLHDEKIEENVLKLMINSLQKILKSPDFRQHLAAIEQYIYQLQKKRGNLPQDLLYTIFDIYSKDQRYFTRLIVEQLAENKEIPLDLLRQLTKENADYIIPLEKIQDPVATLFIALRLVQQSVFFEETTIRHFINILGRRDFSSPDDLIKPRILGIDLFYTIRTTIPPEVKDKLVEVLLNIYMRLGLLQRLKIDSILTAAGVNEIQELRLNRLQEIAVWENAINFEQRLALSEFLFDKFNTTTKTRDELDGFLTSHWSSQNVRLMELAESASKRYNYPIIAAGERERLRLLKYNSCWTRMFCDVYSVTAGNSEFLLNAEQWQSFNERIKQIPWNINKYLYRISFTSIAEMDSFLEYLKDNEITENELKQATDDWIDDIYFAIVYDRLLGNYIRVISQDGLLPNDAKTTLDRSTKRLIEKVQWPSKFLLTLLRKVIHSGDQSDVFTLITGLEKLANYRVSFNEVVDRNGFTVADILNEHVICKSKPITDLLPTIDRLISDNDFFAYKYFEVLITRVRRAKETLDKTGKLDYFLNKNIFEIYEHILTSYPIIPFYNVLNVDEYNDNFYKKYSEILKKEIRALVVDILAEDRHLTEPRRLIIEQLEPLVKAISYEENKKVALFIALRLVQNHILLPETILKQFIGLLYNEDESIRTLAINLYYQQHQSNKKILMPIKDELFDALVLLLPKSSYPRNSYINSVIKGFTLNDGQEARLKTQQKIASWYATTSQREKIALATEISKELIFLPKRESMLFIKELRLSQNSELMEIAESLVKKLDTISVQEGGFWYWLVNLFSQKKDKKAEILQTDMAVQEITTSSSTSLLLSPMQWEDFQYQYHQFAGSMDRIGFVDFRTFNETLIFARKHGLTEETLTAAIISASSVEINNFLSEIGNGFNNESGETLLSMWIVDNISLFYGKILKSLINDIKAYYKLSSSDANALDDSIETLLDLNWPASFLFDLVKNVQQNDPTNIPILLTTLETIADYGISPQMVDRNGRTALGLLEKVPTKKLLPAMNRLIRDNHFATSKEIEELNRELIKLNGDNPLIQQIADEFMELFPKIESLLYGQIKMQNGKLLCDLQGEDFQNWRNTISYIDNTNLVEVIAVLSQAAHNTVLLENNAYPRLVQLFALLLLIKSPRGGLIQIGTGEGKSLINAMFAAIKVMEGHKVDIITTSGDLAQRDALEYKDFYGLFNISVSSNIDNNYKDGAKQCYKSDIVYGDIMEFNGDTLRDITEDVKLGRGFDILIVDEVDSLFIDQNNMKIQLLSSGASGFELLNPLFVYIFGVGTIFGSQLLDRQDGCYFQMPLLNDTQTQNLNAFKLQEMENSEYSFEPIKIGYNCLDVIRERLTNYSITNLFAFEQIREARAYIVPNHLKQFAEDQLQNWIESFFQAYSHVAKRNYIISTPNETDTNDDFSDITVVEPSTGAIIQRLQWGNGLHQFLEVKHRLAMKPENVVTTFMSYYGYFNKYRNRIYGVTGTLGTTTHHKFLRNIYGVDIYSVPIFVEKDLTVFKTMFAINKENWLDEIITAIYRSIINRQRAGLVVAETIAEVEEIRYRLIERGYNPLQIFIYGAGGKDEKNVFRNKLKPGDVIIATNLGGRGVDIKITQEVQKNGGLHLIVTSYPTNSRTRDQVYGRPARKGEPGSRQLILNIEQLNMECLRNENILSCLSEERNRQEKEKLERDQRSLLNIRFLDELFEQFVELIKEADSPTRYKLLVAKPNSKELQPLSFYLYEEKGKIRLKIVDEKEMADLDITDLVMSIDPQTEKHLRTVLSNNLNVASSINGQDREIINFIATLQGYTKVSSIYKHVKYEFDLAEARGEQNRIRFKFLFKWTDSEVDKYLQENIEIRKKYWLWLAVRKLYNNEFEIRQITEEWGIWLKKRYQPMERLGRNINDTEIEEIKKEFELFKVNIIQRIGNKAPFIRNPFYLTLKSWRYLQIYYNQLMDRSASTQKLSTSDNGKSWLDYVYSLGESLWKELKSRIGFGEENYNPPDPLNSAVGFLEDATNLDDISWIPYNALSYIRLLKDGRGIRQESQGEEANDVKSRFINDTSHAIDRIDRQILPAIDSQLSFLFGAKIANYSDDLVANLALQRKIFEKIKEVFRRNIDITAQAKANQMIRNGNPVDLKFLTKDINITQAILEATNRTVQFVDGEYNSVHASGLYYLYKNTQTLDATGRQLIISQILGAGGYLFNVELYDLEKEKKSWWETVFTGVLGVCQVVAGIAIMGLGNVFGATLGLSLIAQGVGDIIQVGVSIFTNTPINFEDYINSKGMAMGIALLTAGSLHFLNMIPALGGVIGGIADKIPSTTKGMWALVGKMAAMQAAATVAGALIYEVARKEVSPEDIKSDVQSSINNMLEEDKDLLNRIVVLDKFNDNSVLRNALDQRIRDIISREQGRFQDDETKFYKGLSGGFANAFGFGTLYRATTDVALGTIKSRQANGRIIRKIREAIREIGGNIDPIDIYMVKLTREFGDTIGKQLGEVVKKHISADNTIKCNKLEKEIQLNDELVKYKKGLVQACYYINGLFNQDYRPVYETMSSNWVELITQMIVSIQKQEIVKPVSDGLGQEAISLMVQAIQKYKQQMEAEKTTKYQEPHRENIDPVSSVKSSGLTKDDTEKTNDAKEGRPKQGNVYKVKPGDNLHKIAKEHGVLYTRLVAANPNIKHPNLIYPGQIIIIPVRRISGSSTIIPANTPKVANDKSFSGKPGEINSEQGIKPATLIVDESNNNILHKASQSAADVKNNQYTYTVKEAIKYLKERGYKQIDIDHSINKNGFFGRAFEKATANGKTEVVIAYGFTNSPKGTAWLNLKSWFGFAQDIDDDVFLFFKKKPDQLTAAKVFVDNVLQKVGLSNVKVTFTGFSLGAALAQLVAIDRELGERAIVFDSPPVRRLVTKVYDPKTIIIYNSLPNIINANIIGFNAEHTVRPIIVYKKGTVNLGFFPPGGVLESHSLAALDAFNDDGKLKPGFIRIQWPTNVMERNTYHSIPEYRDYLYSQWLFQYRFDVFIQTPTWLSPPPIRNFRDTFPTFEKYLGMGIKQAAAKT